MLTDSKPKCRRREAAPRRAARRRRIGKPTVGAGDTALEVPAVDASDTVVRGRAGVSLLQGEER